MKRLQPDPAPTRRDLLACGMRLGAFVLVASLLPNRAPAMDKLPKSAVQYDETTPMPGRDCDDCAQFIAGPAPSAPGTCRIVAGDVSPHGHCIAFAPKQNG